MKALMLNRLNCFRTPGGDTVQMLETKKALEALGVEVEVSLSDSPIEGDYDLVHVFNVQQGAVAYSLRQILRAKERRLPVALSTVYWSWALPQDRGYDRFRASRKKRGARGLIRGLVKKVSGIDMVPPGQLDLICKKFLYENMWQERVSVCACMADVLLPNGMAELGKLSGDTGLRHEVLHAHVIPNGIAPQWARVDPDPEDFASRHDLGPFVLCVGRVQPTKNQHALIGALRDTGVSVVFVGKSERLYGDYCRAQAKRASGKILFLPHMSQAELAGVYASARVHVLPSWRETPGLASLEAAAMGCNVVVTPDGTTREYFGDHAWYCDPSDLGSIREAVLDAFSAEKTTALKTHVRNHYTWKEAGRLTLEAYECVLAHAGQKPHVVEAARLFDCRETGST